MAPPLRITSDRDLPRLNRWADDINNDVRSIKNNHTKLATQVTHTTTTVATTIAPSPYPTSVSVVANGVNIDQVQKVLVTINYTAPNPLGQFAGIFFVVAGYKGQ